MRPVAFISIGSLLLHGTDEHGVRWSVDRREFRGWDATGSTIRVERRTRAHGGWAGEAYRVPRHITIGGLIKAPTEEALWAARDRLDAACTLEETIITVHEPGRDRWVRARREAESLITLHSPTLAHYSVQFVCPDPRRFGAELTTATRLPSTTGGLTIPVTVPFSIPAVTVSGQVSLTNRGNVAGPVVLRIDGPVVGPVVTHVSSGRSLVFASSLSLAAGQFVLVDMERRTVLENGQASRNGWVTERGWSQFQPGVNVWSFTAAEHDPGSLLTIMATEAWE